MTADASAAIFVAALFAVFAVALLMRGVRLLRGDGSNPQAGCFALVLAAGIFVVVYLAIATVIR